MNQSGEKYLQGFPILSKSSAPDLRRQKPGAELFAEKVNGPEEPETSYHAPFKDSSTDLAPSLVWRKPCHCFADQARKTHMGFLSRGDSFDYKKGQERIEGREVMNHM